MTSLEIQSCSAEATWELGHQIGCRAIGGEIIGLIGPLGAGKTVFVQGLAAGLAVKESPVTSPTFVMMNRYEGRLAFCHIDFYRLDGPLAPIWLSEYLDWGGVTAIEWVDKIALLNEERITVQLKDTGDNTRKLICTFSPSLQYLIPSGVCHHG